MLGVPVDGPLVDAPDGLQPLVAALLLGGAEVVVLLLATRVRVCQPEGKVTFLGVGELRSLVGGVHGQRDAVAVGLAGLLLKEVHEWTGENAVADLPRLLVLASQLLQIALASHVLQLIHLCLLVLAGGQAVDPLCGCLAGGRSTGRGLDVGTCVHGTGAAVLCGGRRGGGGAGVRGEENGLLVHILLYVFLLGEGWGGRLGGRGVRGGGGGPGGWGQHSLHWAWESNRYTWSHDLTLQVDMQMVQ